MSLFTRISQSLQHIHFRELTDRLNSLFGNEHTSSSRKSSLRGKYRSLMAQYKQFIKDVVAILDPDNKLSSAVKNQAKLQSGTNARAGQAYKNPKPVK